MSRTEARREGRALPARGGRGAAPGGRRGGWHVYLLRCRDGSLYAGATNDLARRLEAHARGRGSRYTRSRLPVALVFSERAAGRGAALGREAALKRLTRAEKLALVNRAGAPAGAPAPRRAAPRSPSPSRRPGRGA